MNNVIITGVQTLEYPETRPLLLLDVEYSGSNYEWSIYYYGSTASFQDYLSEEVKQDIYDDIQTKEEIWQNLDPKTKTISSSVDDEPITVDILKSEIVKPDFPDYYAKRRMEYPSIYEQLDAIWHGSGSVEYNAMKDKIQGVKNKHAKPN
jgi:hypothetical protein